MKIVVNLIAVIIGVIVGGIINMLIIEYGVYLIPTPEAYDVTNMDTMLVSFHLLEPKHFIMPWMAHALGTFIGALLTFKVAKTNKFYLALIICVFFLFGGIYMVVLLPSPLWFTILDLGLAYLPMVWIINKYFSKKVS